MHSVSHIVEVEAQLKASRREWIGLAVISLPCLLYSMDLTVLNLAVPQISADLRPTSSQLLWIVDIYGFLLAGLLIPMGTLGDRIGRRRLLLIGAAAFGTASVLAALSSSIVMLIVARALLGVAGATLAPSTLSLIRHMFLDPKQRSLAIGVWTASFSIGAAIGPLIGGLLLEHFDWGAVFLIAVPIMILLLVLGPVLLPESRTPSVARMDWISTMQSIATVLLVIFGFKQITAYGWQLLPALSILVGASTGVTFVRRQRSLQHPLLDLNLLRAPAFAAALMAYTLGCFVSVGISLFVSQYLQLVLGLPPLQAGLWTLPGVLGFVLGSIATPAVVHRIPPVAATSVGFAIAAIGLAMIAQMDGDAAIQVLAAGLFVLSLGLAPAFITAINLIIGMAPPERASEVSAISETGSELGSALGIAILGGIGTAYYRSTLTNTMPWGLSNDDMQVASETLGGAFSVAERLSADLSAPLRHAAQAAFHDSLQLVAWSSAAIAVALAMAVVVLVEVKSPDASK